MSRLIAVLSFCALATSAFADHHEKHKQFIEVREYRLKSADAAAEVDAYLTGALVPALNRLGSETVGVFREEQEQEQPIRYVVFAHNSSADFVSCNAKLAKDAVYQKAAASYMKKMKKDTPLVRIRSELLHSFDCWPELKKPEIAGNKGRLYEIRVYESSSEHFGDLKVEMFNAGEVPIFLDSGVVPVFMGQALVGDKTPNLTYMTVYPDQASKDKAWDNFRQHPDWKVLSKVEKYRGTVSKIHKFNLLPVDGSQL